MPYENIPGVGAVYLDGNLVTDSGSGQPRVLILGTAPSGLSYELFRGQSSGEVRTEFGASSEMYRKYHEVRAQGADNIFLMRVGGSQGSVVITDNLGGTLQLTPEYRDAEILDRYALILQPIEAAIGVPGTNDTLRILVYDQLESQFVYDSLEETINGVTIIDTGIIDVTLNGLDLFALNSIADPDNALTLLDMLLGNFTADAAATAATVALTKTAGADGTSPSLPERFAALEVAYHLLDHRDADIVVPAGIHLDDPNVSRGDVPSYVIATATSVPVPGSAGDALGYAWELTYRGKKFVYMAPAATLFSVGTASLAIASTGTNTFTAVATGPAGEDVSIEFTAGATAGAEVVTVVGNAITIQIQTGVSDDDGIETAFNLVAGATALASIASASAGVMVAPVAAAPLALAAGSYLSHADLTGDPVPTAVTKRFREGADGELREVNFAHSLAQFLEWASTSWRTMIGIVSTLPPDGFSRLDVAGWVGERPVFTNFGGVNGIDSAADEGVGLLGNKFMTGAVGYRFAELVNGTAGDGLAYGGFIKTIGADLPNNSHSYGVDHGDELQDLNARPVDIGKHIFVTYEHPVHVNNFGTYRGSFEAAFAGKLTTLAANLEPIGEQNGLMTAIVSPVRVPITLQNDLAGFRFIGVQQVDGVGPVIVNSKTAAHPSSDWTRISTIRSVNRELEGIRRICRGYIGKPFSSTQLLSLQTAIDGFLKAERQLGYNGGAVARLRYTRSEKVIGRLTVALTMIPPFSIERITVETSLAAEASEL
jgi:hypothetical protein